MDQGFASQLALLKWPLIIPTAALLPTFLAMFVPLWVSYDKSLDSVLYPEPLLPEVYDYIVIGAGTAGMIVATRLAENDLGRTVLLLEAGGEPTPFNQIPYAEQYMASEIGNQWTYSRPLPPPANQSADDQCGRMRIYTSKGKMLGGSSSINFHMHVRGNREDFNGWAQILNDSQWNYENVLPYFKKFENYSGNHAIDSEYHGTSGPVHIGKYDFQPGFDDFLAAAVEKGYRVGDYNGENQNVFSPIDTTTKDGYRVSSYSAYYKDAIEKPNNLIIKKYADVTKINIDMNKRATGVEYTRHGMKKSVHANLEIILSAGALNSPQILMLSGIGPKEDLEELNIPVIQDLPVGQNLQDHVFTVIGPFFKGPSLSINADISTQAALTLAFNGSGPLAAPMGLSGLGFLQSPQAQPPYPNLQVIQLAYTIVPEMGRDLGYFFGLGQQNLDSWLQPFVNQEARFFILTLNRPKSVGALKLFSADPSEAPMINPNYFCDPDDIAASLYGIKTLVDLYENTKALGVPLFNVSVPGCEGHVFKSDDYYKCVMNICSGSIFHHMGTIAMGSVVSSELKVFGIKGLRVVDGSVFPKAPNGNPNAAIMMIAEKAADLIINCNN